MIKYHRLKSEKLSGKVSSVEFVGLGLWRPERGSALKNFKMLTLPLPVYVYCSLEYEEDPKIVLHPEMNKVVSFLSFMSNFTKMFRIQFEHFG